MVDLSILIPARNEIFLSRTVEDILQHSEANTEVIVVLDGCWAEPPIKQDARVTVLHYPKSIGQRAACNSAARVSSGKYLIKTDAHCSFGQGFDRILLEDMQDDWTQVPIMRNLHAFDWVCRDCGERRYQGPSGPCKKCGGQTIMDIVWIAKPSPQSTSYCFDPTPHFQYFNDYRKRDEYLSALKEIQLTESMSLQGSFFMVHRDKYFALNLCDEGFGSWGSQGIEVACKTWLSGGRVIVNHKTYYAHMFRTQGGDFGFPYKMSNSQVEHAKKTAEQLFLENKWPMQTRPLSWLLKRFWPVPGWTEGDIERVDTSVSIKQPSVGIVYYTDNRLDENIMRTCQEQLLEVSHIPIVSVSLKPIGFGENYPLPLERGYLTMFKQILTGLEALDCDVVFFAEHDILYHPTHFEFLPSRHDVYYYNTNVWKLRLSDGHCLHYDVKQTSGLCAYRELLIAHYRERVKRVEAYGYDRRMGFEPGTHNRTERIDDHKSMSWESQYPNVDIRHDQNLTPSRWSKDKFRNQCYTQGWTEATEIAGWGNGIELANRIRGQ